MKLKIYLRKRNEKKNNHMETKQQASKKPMGHEEIKKEIKKYLETIDNEDISTQNLLDAQKQCSEGNS